MKQSLCIILVLQSLISYGQEYFFDALADSAATLSNDYVVYDPSYFSIPYPGGDVPEEKGVCTDVIIRAYRKMGIDLQKEVHIDMNSNFNQYPSIWNLNSTDRNIDHRRVPNLMAYFDRHNAMKSISANASDYLPGDIVCWNLGGAITHIGIVINKKSSDGQRYLIIHNIGAGQVIADCLFDYKVIGHYRFKI